MKRIFTAIEGNLFFQPVLWKSDGQNSHSGSSLSHCVFTFRRFAGGSTASSASGTPHFFEGAPPAARNAWGRGNSLPSSNGWISQVKPEAFWEKCPEMRIPARVAPCEQPFFFPCLSTLATCSEPVLVFLLYSNCFFIAHIHRLHRLPVKELGATKVKTVELSAIWISNIFSRQRQVFRSLSLNFHRHRIDTRF